MFDSVNQSANTSIIDDRNDRPLAIALAAIVVVWSMALALTCASWIGAQSPYDPVEAAFPLQYRLPVRFDTIPSRPSSRPFN